MPSLATLASPLLYAVLVFLCVMLGSPAWALSPSEADHLSSRLSFGASQQELAKLAPLSRDQAVSRYFSQNQQGCEAESIPAWAVRGLERTPASDAAAQLQHLKQRYGHRVQLQTWWLNGMAASAAPLCERMALFWHQYFPIQIHQTTSEAAAVRQVQRFRRQWAGNFRVILREMSRDPAMQEYLGLISNRKASPNENYARELLELYTLGPGYYSEQDIREAARAYTGWRTIRRMGLFVVWWPDHDFGQKVFLGRRGAWDGDDIVDIVLAQPRTAEFVVEKLWREFISPTPDASEVRRLAARFRQDWEMKPVLQAMFQSPHFWAVEARDTLIKSPVELAIGAVRQSQARPVQGNALAAWTWAMGQGLYFPPDVKGWRGNTEWITAQTLQTRQSFLRGLARGFSDDQIATLIQQIYEYPGFDEQSLTVDSHLLSAAVGRLGHPELEKQWDTLEYQLK